MLRLIMVAVVGAVALMQPGASLAHGDVDQTLQGDANCNVFNFPGSVTSAGGQRQEFVPTQPGLAAVDVCASPVSGPTEIDVIVRSGTVGAPGAVLGGASVVVANPGYAHADFVSVIPLTPGQKYVIELASSLDITWHGMPFDAEIYPAGESNAPDVVRDFAFRTYAGALPVQPTATVTRTPLATKTRAPSATPAPSRTATPAPSQTPQAATATPPPPPPLATQPGPAAASPAVGATATRTSGVLGGARRVGAIRLPDVGHGDDSSRRAGAHLVAAMLVLAGAAASFVMAGVVRSIR
jgi:hypothetical protein